MIAGAASIPEKKDSLPSPEALVANPKLLKGGWDLGKFRFIVRKLELGKKPNEAVSKGKGSTKLIQILNQKGAVQKFIEAIEKKDQAALAATERRNQRLHQDQQKAKIRDLNDSIASEISGIEAIGVTGEFYTLASLKKMGIEQGNYYYVRALPDKRLAFFGKLSKIEFADGAKSGFPVFEFIVPGGKTEKIYSFDFTQHRDPIKKTNVLLKALDSDLFSGYEDLFEVKA